MQEGQEFKNSVLDISKKKKKNHKKKPIPFTAQGQLPNFLVVR